MSQGRGSACDPTPAPALQGGIPRLEALRSAFLRTALTWVSLALFALVSLLAAVYLAVCYLVSWAAAHQRTLG
jgi:hypothetical protein